MKLMPIVPLVTSLLFAQGCMNPGAGTEAQPPGIQISAFKIEKTAGGGGSIHVEGSGATAISQVVVSLDYTVAGDDTETELGSVNADKQGLFSLTVFQKCILPSQTSPMRTFINVRDAATGREARTPPLDSSFLVCPP